MKRLEFQHPEEVSINAYPDSDYPIRVLEAYRELCNSRVYIDTNGTEDEFCRIMNESQQERAVLLDAAIAALRALGVELPTAGEEG